jgi:hypothetical protein
MTDGAVRIHLVSGEHVDVPGSVTDLQSSLLSERDAILLEDRNGRHVLVNPVHVTHVTVVVVGSDES